MQELVCKVHGCEIQESEKDAKASAVYWHNKYEEQKLLTKRILVEIQQDLTDFCDICHKYGQYLPECDNLQNDECAYHLMQLAENYYGGKANEQPAQKNEEKC